MDTATSRPVYPPDFTVRIFSGESGRMVVHVVGPQRADGTSSTYQRCYGDGDGHWRAWEIIDSWLDGPEPTAEKCLSGV